MVSEGARSFCSSPEDDLVEGILFHVHVQLTDRFGRTYFDWVVYKTFQEFFDLHRFSVSCDVCVGCFQCYIILV